MRIGIDIDGVVSDSYPLWMRELNGRFQKNITTLERYELHLVYNIPPEEFTGFFVQNREMLLGDPQPVRGAQAGIESILGWGHEIIYVTARRPEEEDLTKAWLLKHGFPYERVLFSNLGGKEKMALQWGMRLFIEDYLVNASKISQRGVPVLLLDTTYNRGDLPSGVTRCRDWSEILQVIEAGGANRQRG
ncbi:MAG: hypothetical protein LBT32_03115 [Peptococcaceae bacterium]|jgi:uncharacterized HAD superfamily protein|nr:hypothetical protein [Peptococcaceae bacterium]